MGFDERAREALGAIRKTYAPGLPDVFVTLAGLGQITDFASVVPEARADRIWRSTTPFVPPRHPKARGANTLTGLIQRELQERGFPESSLIELELDDGSFMPLLDWQRAEGTAPRPTTRFRMHRREREHRPPPVRFALGLRMHFAVPISGPVSLGYGSHFGLGAFQPVASCG
jgi:CRISPR-associated protein Csb2